MFCENGSMVQCHIKENGTLMICYEICWLHDDGLSEYDSMIIWEIWHVVILVIIGK